MIEEKSEETKVDKIISWIVIMGFFVLAYNVVGVSADLIRELIKHIF